MPTWSNRFTGRPTTVDGVSERCCDGAGVLVLSEFAGAAQSLGAGAILVNPWNITDMAAAIEDALTMSDQVRQGVPARSHVPLKHAVHMSHTCPQDTRRHLLPTAVVIAPCVAFHFASMRGACDPPGPPPVPGKHAEGTVSGTPMPEPASSLQ